MRNRFAMFVVGFLLITLQSATAANAPLPQIWFSMGGQGKPETYQSWDTLFYQPAAPWPDVMNHVKAVGMLTQVLHDISDENLAKVVARLKQKHIALGIEMLAQAYTLPGINSPPGCGEGVEGYYAPFATAALAAKLRRAGGTLQFIAMDEPLFFGHYYNERNACHSSIENVVDRIAANIREYQKVFPDVVVGDIEPLPVITAQPGWQNDYREWLRLFRAKIGRPLAYTYIDINWGHKNWPQSVQAFVRFAGSVQMPIGMIYNAAPPTKVMTNEQWLDDAQRNFVYIERTLRVSPSWVMFTSWVRFPGRAISVKNGLGEDYLVKQYLKLHSVQ